MKKIDISQIGEVLSNFDKKLLIVGQPKGVGLTTEIMTFFAEKLFYEESFSVLILVNSHIERLNIVEFLKKYYKENFDYDTAFNFNNNILYVFDNFVGIVIEDEKVVYNTSSSNHIFDFLYIDKDSESVFVDYYLENILTTICVKGVIATYDTPDSIFYMPDAKLVEKIIVHSERSKENIQKLSELGSYTDGYEKIIKGNFDEKID